MKKLLYSLMILVGWSVSSLGYALESIQQQGFESFAEKDGKIVFSCKAQCVYVLGAYSRRYDYIAMDIAAKGQGNIGYGLVNGQQIVPGEVVPIQNGIGKFSFSRLAFLSQIPEGMPLVMIVDGAVSGEMTAKFGTDTFGESVSNGWNEFWTFDSFRPYSINLLYGPKIGGVSVNGTFYALFILFSIFAIFILFFRGKEKKILIALSVIGGNLWALYDIRMTLELNGYYLKDYREYISEESGARSFRDRGDFYDFMAFAEKTLHETGPSNDTTVSFFTDSEWPFYGSATYFLLPYTLEKNKKEADISVFYGYKDVMVSGDELVV